MKQNQGYADIDIDEAEFNAQDGAAYKIYEKYAKPELEALTNGNDRNIYSSFYQIREPCEIVK